MKSLIPVEPSRETVRFDLALSHAHRPMRITHIVSSLQVGGMEQFVVRLAAHQCKQGADVRILTLRDGPLRARAAAEDVPVNLITASNRASRMWRVGRVFRRFRPDIIHAHNTTSLQFATLGSTLSGAKLLLTWHGRGKGIPRRLSAWERRRAVAVITVSKAAASEVEADFAGKIRVIHNGVEMGAPTHPREQTRSLLNLDTTPVAITVARMDALKGHAILLHSLAILRDQGCALLALLVGDGPERAALERLADELKLDARHVRFLGFREDVTDLLAASDLFVLPSLSEGLPLSILEAMAQSLPIVATQVGGIPELVEPGRQGLLVPPEDAAALAAALNTLTANAVLRQDMGRAGRERVCSAFSFDQMAAQYAHLYATL